jgi:hypothetical protein
MRFFIYFCTIFLSLNALCSELTKELFVSEVANRLNRVEEFRFIAKTARELGIENVYLFGGTASAYGHYVRWDLLRENGQLDLQENRFDYHYTSIFREDQDIDIVVDGNIEQAIKLENKLSSEYSYFMGSKSVWEVRLLKEPRGDKEALLKNFDFLAQNTDSNSTGLISLYNNSKEVLLDLRDWGNIDNNFVNDLFKGEITYYYSKDHHLTSRFTQKLNPQINSVIRYFIKVVQYDLKTKKSDLMILKKIIEGTSFEDIEDSREISWLKNNGKKLIKNAIDIEYSMNLIEQYGLKKKLIELLPDTKIESLSWWLNKEPLRSYPIKKSNNSSESARKIFGKESIIVAHETNNYSAYESITKAFTGTANVLISRDDIEGEMAADGDGFYVKLGSKGGTGSGITIRFHLNPDAINGKDFLLKGNDLIVKNKNALRVINESLDLSLEDYFRSLSEGLFIDEDDRGVLKRLERRIHSQSKNIPQKTQEYIYKLVKKYTSKKDLKFNRLLLEWLSFEFSNNYPDIIDKLIKEKNIYNRGDVRFAFELLSRVLRKEDTKLGRTNYDMDKYFKFFLLVWEAGYNDWGSPLKQIAEEWFQKEQLFKSKTLLNEFIKNYSKWFKKHPKLVDEFMVNVLLTPYWLKNDKVINFLLDELLERYDIDLEVIRILPQVATHARAKELITKIYNDSLKNRRYYQDLLNVILLDTEFRKRDDLEQIFKELILNDTSEDQMMLRHSGVTDYIFVDEYWQNKSFTEELFIKWITLEDSEFMKQQKKTSLDFYNMDIKFKRDAVNDVLQNRPEWLESKKLREVLYREGYIENQECNELLRK